MSWLSTIKNNIIAAIDKLAPAPEQAPVHAKTTAVATAIGDLLSELESVAGTMLDTTITTKFGPAADVLAHDFYTAVIALATARKAATTQPTPTPISTAPVNPTASPGLTPGA